MKRYPSILIVALVLCSCARQDPVAVEGIAKYELDEARGFAEKYIVNYCKENKVEIIDFPNGYVFDWQTSYPDGVLEVCFSFAVKGSSLIQKNGQIVTVSGGFPNYIPISIKIVDRNLTKMVVSQSVFASM